MQEREAKNELLSKYESINTENQLLRAKLKEVLKDGAQGSENSPMCAEILDFLAALSNPNVSSANLIQLVKMTQDTTVSEITSITPRSSVPSLISQESNGKLKVKVATNGNEISGSKDRFFCCISSLYEQEKQVTCLVSPICLS